MNIQFNYIINRAPIPMLKYIIVKHYITFKSKAHRNIISAVVTVGFNNKLFIENSSQ